MTFCYTHISVPFQLSSEKLPLAADENKFRDPQRDNTQTVRDIDSHNHKRDSPPSTSPKRSGKGVKRV